MPAAKNEFENVPLLKNFSIDLEERVSKLEQSLEREKDENYSSRNNIAKNKQKHDLINLPNFFFFGQKYFALTSFSLTTF